MAIGIMPARLAAAELTVFVASSLTEVMEELAADFEAQTAQEVRIVAGASSSLARQIEKGAPADVFLSANLVWADYVTANSDFASPVALFGNGLVLVSASEIDASFALDQLPQLVGPGRLAIGDPAHVPGGQYARIALEKAGVWNALREKLIPAADVRGALAYVRQGAAEFAIVYATDVMGTSLAHVAIDPALFGSVVYYLVASNGLSAQSSDFVDYLLGPQAGSVFERMGFVVVRD